jgi:hypothetical protein
MLKEKFDMAHQVRQRRKDGRRMLLPKYLRSKPHSELDLVYLVTSPDYCEFDVKRGSLGTKGRECDPVGFTLSPSSHCCRELFVPGSSLVQFNYYFLVEPYYALQFCTSFNHDLKTK